MSREALARAWAAGAGPGDDPLTIDLDSTVCETYGLCKEGAQRHNYAGQRGYHPLFAIAASSGDVLMARLRQAGPGESPDAIGMLISPVTGTATCQNLPIAFLTHSALVPVRRNQTPPALPLIFHTSSDQPRRVPSVDLV